MKHLTDDMLWTMVAGPGAAAWRAHLDTCPRCRERFDEWRAVHAGLADLEREALDEREIHRLSVLFRARGPQPAGHTELWTRLLRSAPLVPMAVRGAAMPVLAEHGVGPYHVTVQVCEETAGAHHLHGQVIEGGAPAGRGEVVLSTEDGRLLSGPIDELGEFDLEGVGPGRYRATLLVEKVRVVVESLPVGTTDGT